MIETDRHNTIFLYFYVKLVIVNIVTRYNKYYWKDFCTSCTMTMSIVLIRCSWKIRKKNLFPALLRTKSACIIILTYRLNHIHCLSVIYFSLSCWKWALTKCISAIYVTEKPVSWMMVAPSLTPNKSPGVSNNPGLRLYKFNTNTGHVSIICSSEICICKHVMVIF